MQYVLESPCKLFGAIMADIKYFQLSLVAVLVSDKYFRRRMIMHKLDHFLGGSWVNTVRKSTYDKLMKWCKKKDIAWRNGARAIDADVWKYLWSYTCVKLEDGKLIWSSIPRSEAITLHVEDIYFSMPIIKPGMVVELKNGKRYMVLSNDLNVALINEDGCIVNNTYHYDLSNKDEDKTITKVYAPEIASFSNMLGDESHVIFSVETDSSSIK